MIIRVCADVSLLRSGLLTAVVGMIDICKALASETGLSEINQQVDMDGDRIRMIGSLG